MIRNKKTATFWLPFFYSGSFCKKDAPVSAKRSMQDQSQDSAGDNLADAYGQHHKRDRERRHIGVFQYERYDDRVGDDGRKRGQETALVPEHPGKDRADQGRQASEDNIRKDTSAEDVAEQAS